MSAGTAPHSPEEAPRGPASPPERGDRQLDAKATKQAPIRREGDERRSPRRVPIAERDHWSWLGRGAAPDGLGGCARRSLVSAARTTRWTALRADPDDRVGLALERPAPCTSRACPPSPWRRRRGGTAPRNAAVDLGQRDDPVVRRVEGRRSCPPALGAGADAAGTRARSAGPRRPAARRPSPRCSRRRPAAARRRRRARCRRRCTSR